jgi:hypothetical protein
MMNPGLLGRAPRVFLFNNFGPICLPEQLKCPVTKRERLLPKNFLIQAEDQSAFVIGNPLSFHRILIIIYCRGLTFNENNCVV